MLSGSYEDREDTYLEYEEILKKWCSVLELKCIHTCNWRRTELPIIFWVDSVQGIRWGLDSFSCHDDLEPNSNMGKWVEVHRLWSQFKKLKDRFDRLGIGIYEW